MTAAVSRGTKPKLSVMPPVVVFDEILLEIVTPAIGEKPAETHFCTPQAVYGIHPTTEAAVLDALTPLCRELIEGEHGYSLCELKKGHEGDHDVGFVDLPF